MNDSTRISDLPQQNVNTNNVQSIQKTQNNQTYETLNIHSNPYGNGNNAIQELQPYPREDRKQTTDKEIERQHLPSRDIGMNVNSYIQDEEVNANYIPKTKNIKDYIKDHEDDQEERIINHRNEKNRKQLIGEVFSEFQDVFMVAILYFISQMSIINSIMRKNLMFLEIYNSDGNLNLKGMIFKSMIFAIIYGFAFNIGDNIFLL
jgi:hypothetical protein